MSNVRRDGKWGRKLAQGIAPPRPSLDLIRRLLDWVVLSDEGFTSPCWLWQGRTDADGYPEVKWRGRKYYAHRLAFTAFHGPMREGTDVDHVCMVRGCCNPEHLQESDPLTNRVTERGRRMECPV